MLYPLSYGSIAGFRDACKGSARFSTSSAQHRRKAAQQTAHHYSTMTGWFQRFLEIQNSLVGQSVNQANIPGRCELGRQRVSLRSR